MTKTQILINKTVYLGLSMLDLSKTVMHEFWYDYIKLKYEGKAKLFYMDTDSFIVHINANDIYKYIAKDIKTRFDTKNYELRWPPPKGKNKTFISVMKDELSEKIMKEFVGLRAKPYSYLKDGNSEDEKAEKTNLN